MPIEIGRVLFAHDVVCPLSSRRQAALLWMARAIDLVDHGDDSFNGGSARYSQSPDMPRANIERGDIFI
jgi:hypothetical protein